LFDFCGKTNGMKLVAQIKLRPTPAQHAALKATLERANAACNAISDYAWANQLFNQFKLHKVLYVDLRSKFSLGSQMTVRCLSKVADSYKLDKLAKRQFKAHGSIAFDLHILKYFTEQQVVSIWTLGGREKIAYQCGERQREMLKHQKGESDLVYHRSEFYLLATCEVPEEPLEAVDSYLGVDRGVVNVATDSDGNLYTGQRVEQRRKRYSRQRQELQKANTKKSRRKVRRIGNKQARFQRDVNHCIAKELVKRAKRTKQGIALEDLTGINLRTRVRRETRAERGNWSFDQLGQFIEYKAARYGVPYAEVDPCYTSQRCAACGHTEKANRRSQSEFLCCACGHTAHADVNAAINISVAACQPANRLNERPPVPDQGDVSMGQAPGFSRGVR
jgi:IS605 OrfB family transposase